MKKNIGRTNMINYPAVGEKWGRMQCVEHAVGEQSVIMNGKQEVYKGLILLLKCQCGFTFTLNRLQWKGKKYHKDCGCGIADKDGTNVNKTVSVPITLWEQIKDYANRNTHSNTSQAIRELSEIALEVTSGKLAK